MAECNWNGEWTKELEEVYKEYFKIFNCTPDGYEDCYPNVFPYDVWLDICKLAVMMKKQIPDIIDLILQANDDE